MARRKRRKFTEQFKTDAVRLVTSGSKTIAEVRAQFDLTETALREWVRRAEADAGKAAPDALTTAERGVHRPAQAAEARRDGARHPRKNNNLLREGERVIFELIFLWKARWPVSIQCAVLGVSRSGYYAWNGRPTAPRTVQNAKLVVEITAAHQAGRGTYGSPRVHRELRAKGRRHLRDRRLHRQLLQPLSSAFRPRLREPDRTNGKTPATIVSVAHLDDEERTLMFAPLLAGVLTCRATKWWASSARRR